MATPKVGRMGQYAGFVSRAAALIMDIVIIMLTIAIVNAVIALPLVYFLKIDPRACPTGTGIESSFSELLCYSLNVVWILVTIFTGPLYFISLFTATGQTIGKYVMGVRVVRLDGRPMKVSTSFMRWLGYFVSLLPLGLGFVWVIIDDRRQGFHDRMAGTSVIYSWRANGNEFLLDRVRQRFRRRKQPVTATSAPSVAAGSTGAQEIVAMSVPTIARVSELLNMVQDMIDRHEIAVTGSAVVAKSTSGQLRTLGTSDLRASYGEATELNDTLQLSPAQNAALARDLPADSFILVVMLSEQLADILVRQISRRTAAVVRRFDLETGLVAVPSTPVSR